LRAYREVSKIADKQFRSKRGVKEIREKRSFKTMEGEVRKKGRTKKQKNRRLIAADPYLQRKDKGQSVARGGSQRGLGL